MGQKLGFLLTQPPADGTFDQFSGTSKKLVEEGAGSRELTGDEQKCIDELFETMAKTASDFTDTFRILGKVKADQSNKEEIVNYLVSISAGLKYLDKQNKPKYSQEQVMKLAQLLSVAPQILPKYGLSVADAKNEIQKF